MKSLRLGILALALLSPSASAANGFRLLELNQRAVKWGVTQIGMGVSLTYAVIPAKAKVAGVENCKATTSMSALLAHSTLSLRDFDQELSAAFKMWERAANLHFRKTDDVAKADLLIGAEAVADGVGYADVTTAPLPDQAFDSITKGIVCLNPTLHWQADAVQNSSGGKSSKPIYRLRIVLAHEIGHVLGLDHPSPQGELMSFEYDATIQELQPGDIAGITALYGPSRTGGGGVVASALNH